MVENACLLHTHYVSSNFQGGRGVPVIVPHDIRTILAYLADADVRRESEIPVENNYLFPNTSKNNAHLEISR